MSKGRKPIAGKFRRTDYQYVFFNYKTDGKLDREKLLQDARRVAKATNQRLLRLERAGMTDAAAYKGAEKAIQGVYSKTDSVIWGHITKGRPRYTESKTKLAAMSNDDLLHMLYSMDKAQQARTSTPGTVKEVYSVGLERLKGMLDKSIADKVELNDLMYLFKTQALREADKLYGYNAVLQAFNSLQDTELKDLEKQAAGKGLAMDYSKMKKDALQRELKARGKKAPKSWTKKKIIEHLEKSDKDDDTRKNYLISKLIEQAVGDKNNLADVFKELGIGQNKRLPNSWIEDV